MFDEATFSGDAWFSEATFSGDAMFDGATFNGFAGFDEATFSGNARFDGATFSDRRLVQRRRPSAAARVACLSSDHASGQPDAQHVWPTGWCLGPDGSGGYTVVRANDDGRSGLPATRADATADPPAGHAQ